MRHLLVLVVALACSVSLSCQVNDYCLNCANGDGGNGDANGDGKQDGGNGDGGLTDGGPCVPTGIEICDGKDNDCNGAIDDGILPEVGDLCTEQRGECQGAVKQCVGGVLRCSKVPVAEKCNLKDDDCDGVIDNGDPSDGINVSGAKCGTDAGECVAGRFHCNTQTGVVTCGLNCGTAQAFDCPVGGAVPPFGTGTDTLCNGKDDDCDGNFDEDVPSGGPCGGGTVNDNGTNGSICKQGTLQCVGGTTVCVGSIDPEPFETCDLKDNNCNGQIDEGFNLATDPQNCGACGAVCDLPNAFEGCTDPDGAGPLPPACTVIACATGFHNNDGQAANGCEFGPCTITSTIEVCNGIDDDCNPATGPNTAPGAPEVNLTPPPGLCLTKGACAGSVATCHGVDGFRCDYGPGVEVDSNGNVVGQETLCDGIDNDCDGIVDEGEPGLGDFCAEAGKQGICQGTGTIQCVPGQPTQPPVCTITNPGLPQQAVETCNGLDDNCNGEVDEGANTGNLLGQEWVDIPGIPGVQIMKYEASRRDAGDTFDGTTNTFACSKEGVLPWTNITYPTAKAVCESMTNGRLCTEAEWQAMCMPTVSYGTNGVPGPLTTSVTDFTFIEAEDFLTNTTIPTGDSTRAWTRVAPLDQNGATFMQVPDNGFNQLVAANAVAQSSRLDYRLDLLGSTSYNIWARVRSPAANVVAPVLRGSTQATATLAPTAPATTQVGDLVIVSTWSVATNNNIPSHGTGGATPQAGFTLIQTGEYDEGGDSNVGRLSVAFTIATVAGAQTYQAFTNSNGTAFTGLVVIQAGTFNAAAIASPAAVETTNTNAPNPPTSSSTAVPAIILAYGGWHLNPAANASVSPPSNAGFTELWELSGSVAAEFSVASTSITSGTVDPLAFGDDVGPQGTIAITVTIPAFTSGSRSMHVGLTAGTGTPAAPTTTISTATDNLTSWRVSGTLTTGAAGTYTLSLYTREDGLLVDTIAIARQNTTSPTFDNAWAYQTNPRTPQPTTCNADDLDTDPGTTGDQDGTLPTGSLAACFANHADPSDAFDMSGNVKEWTLARAPNQNPLRGGASNNEVLGTTCQLNFSLADDSFFFPNVGFRCCRGP